MLVKLTAVMALTPLGGCASTLTAWKNRPVAAHTLKPGRFFTLTGERRLAFQVERPDDKRLAWCAESLPDVAQAVSSSSKLSSQLSKNSNVGAEDAFGTTLTQTFTRTEIAEVYRQMAWQACQAWAQGVYSNDQYRANLDLLLKSGMKVIEMRATQPLTPLATPDTSAADKAKEEAAKKKAAEDKAAKCAKTPAAAECKAAVPPPPAS